MFITSVEIQAAFNQEITRLLALGLTPEQETLARRYYSDKERQSMDEGSFCGPHRSFPVTSEADVDNAAHLIGKADDPEAVKRCIIGKAKAHGWNIPDAWKEDIGKQDRASANHAPFTGTHTHAHPAFGSQGDDGSHEHEHSHSNDANHDHTHAESRVASSSSSHVINTSDRQLSLYAPITRVDATKREVWGQATAEVPDSYGTIFGYCPDAWTKWRGNIREQHDSKKAVGKAIDIKPLPEERAIYVGSRVSRGAQDTWLKVEDDVLTGYSASIIPDPEYGNEPAYWPKKVYNGKKYPYLPRYTIAELSLVDNPACPNCDIQIVRADGFVTEVVEVEEEEIAPPPVPVEQQQETQDRAGARISADTRTQLHSTIKSLQQTCNCEDCQTALNGDGSASDNDGDEDMERKITGMIERALQSVYIRLQSIAGQLSRSNAPSSSAPLESVITTSMNRALETIDARIAETASSQTEARAELSAVKELVERIANQPMPGGPILNGARPVDKRLPTDPIHPMTAPTPEAMFDAFARMSQAGAFPDMNSQINAAAAVLATQPQPNRR